MTDDPDVPPPEPPAERCPCCDGTGHVVLTGPGTENASSNLCPVCGGSGRLLAHAAKHGGDCSGGKGSHRTLKPGAGAD